MTEDQVMMVDALRGERNLVSAGQVPTRTSSKGMLFNRDYTVTVNGMTFRNRSGDHDDGLDIEFEVPFDDDAEPNEAKVRIYNLADATIEQMRKDSPLSIVAGYRGDTGQIFSGAVSNATTKWQGCDKCTEITALDCGKLDNNKKQKRTYKKGITAEHIIRDMAGMMGLPIAELKLKENKTYAKGLTVDDNPYEEIQKQAKECGSRPYIIKGRLYVRKKLDGDDTGITLSADSGLIGTPESIEVKTEGKKEKEAQPEKGWKVTSLLMHRITTASKIAVKSRTANGEFVYRRGRHFADKSNYYTEGEVF